MCLWSTIPPMPPPQPPPPGNPTGGGHTGAIYASSKAAVHSLTDSLRVELRPFGVRVVLVMPGAIRSHFGANTAQRIDMAR